MPASPAKPLRTEVDVRLGARNLHCNLQASDYSKVVQAIQTVLDSHPADPVVSAPAEPRWVHAARRRVATVATPALGTDLYLLKLAVEDWDHSHSKGQTQ